jgi:hypothetical protein
MIIGKYGLLKRVNVWRFIINAVATGMYALAIFAMFGAGVYFILVTSSDTENSVDVASNTLQVYLTTIIIGFCS